MQQPSVQPELVFGARLWAMTPREAGDPDLATRYRLYAALRVPVLRLAAMGQGQRVVQAARQEAMHLQHVEQALLLREVGTCYVALRAAREATPAHAALCDVRRRQLEVARARLLGGLGTAAEVARAEQQLRAAELVLQEALRSARTAEARLEALSGLALSGVTLLPLPDAACPSAETAAQRAAAQRPEVLLHLAESERHRAQARLAWRDALDVSLVFSASHGTTAWLDELNGLSAQLEVRGALDAPLRAQRQMARDLSAARAATLEAEAAAEQAAHEARLACDAHQRALNQVAVQQAQLEYARREHERLRGRRALVTPGAESVVDMPQLLEAEAAQRDAEARLVEARGQAELAQLAVLLAQGEDLTRTSAPRERGGLPTAANQTSPPEAAPVHPASLSRPEAPPTRGLWVWQTQHILQDQDGPAALRAFVGQHRLTEVYLSTSRAVLAHPRLEALLSALHQDGIRVEALLGEPTWYLEERRAEPLRRIAELVRWNQQHPTARFDGIHLDIEPHQLPDNKGPDNLAFLPGLIATLQEAQRAAQAAGLTLAADLPRKILRAEPTQGAALASACQRLFLMLYEMPRAADIAAAARLALRWGAGVVIGLRPRDHEGRLDELLVALQTSLAQERGYLGWALHDYDAYRKR